MQLFGFYASGAMTIMMFIALASVAGLVVLLVALFRSRPVRALWSPPTGESQAVTILRERFARGEISEDEYRRRLDVLAKG
jgi:putative membrane protein